MSKKTFAQLSQEPDNGAHSFTEAAQYTGSTDTFQPEPPPTYNVLRKTLAGMRRAEITPTVSLKATDKKFKLYDEVQLTEPRSSFVDDFEAGDVFFVLRDAGKRGWDLMDKFGLRLNDVSEDFLEYSQEHQERQLDYNMILISNFMDHITKETGTEISEAVFESFFNA